MLIDLNNSYHLLLGKIYQIKISTAEELLYFQPTFFKHIVYSNPDKHIIIYRAAIIGSELIVKYKIIDTKDISNNWYVTSLGLRFSYHPASIVEINF